MVVLQGGIHSNMQWTKRANTHENIQTVIFTKVPHKNLI